MIKVGIDTNVLLRLLVDDDERQRAAVLKFGAGIGTAYSGFITVVSLIEIDWALRTRYGFARRDSVAAIRRLLRLRGVEIQSAEAVVRSLAGVDDGNGDFADLMIAHLSLHAGCDRIVTLDKKAASKIPVMELLQ